MRAFRAGLAAAVASLFLVGVTGCEPGNEEQAKLESAPAVGPGGGPPPKNQKEYYEAQKAKQGANQNPYGQGYPGASGGPSR